MEFALNNDKRSACMPTLPQLSSSASRLMAAVLLSYGVLSSCFVYGQGAEKVIEVDLAAQPLESALRSMADKHGMQILFNPNELRGLTIPPIKGKYTTTQLLERMVEGTGLTAVHDGKNAIAVKPKGGERNPRTSEGGRGVDAPVIAQSAGAVQQSGGQESVRTGKATPGEKIEVTGSRLSRATVEGPQEIKTYTRQQIQQSGQSNLADFLYTLPEVSIAMNTFAGLRSTAGAQYVQLRGLPVGTTLVLINGRRIGVSSGQAQFNINIFDLNALPIAAVERIEILATGSSAVYGSDAIAGVVNIVLKRDLDGGEVSVKYGAADGTDNKSASLALGKRWDRGSLILVGGYQAQSELLGAERQITSTGDFRSFGGLDTRSPGFCNPGNIYSVDGRPLPGLGSATFAAVPAGLTGTATRADFVATAGTLNLCSLNPLRSYIPAAERSSLLGAGHFQVGPSLDLFTEFMFARTRQVAKLGAPLLFGIAAFQTFRVPAANPFNPFGVPVGIGNQLVGHETAQVLPTDFGRALVGARGALGSWDWEIASWQVRDKSTYSSPNQLNAAAVTAALNSTNPATALNPFVAGPLGPAALIQSLFAPDQLVKTAGQKSLLNAYARGPVVQLPAGPLDIVAGSEFSRDKLDIDRINFPGIPPGTRDIYERDSSALFVEARIPVLGKPQSAGAAQRIDLTLAGRYDHDEYFGNKATPQAGVEWRPSEALLIRANAGRSFKAPSLVALFSPLRTVSNTVADPRRGGAATPVSVDSGGNSMLNPETGSAHSEGIVYSSRLVPNLQTSVTHWGVVLENNIQAFGAQAIVNNESIFPNRVLRNASGVITAVNATNLNFGRIEVKGVDYQVNWQFSSTLGTIRPSIAATQTYHYTAAIQPGAAATDRASMAAGDFNWAPRWKGVAAVDWSRPSFQARVAGRYVGRYRDYNPMPSGDYLRLGNFWLWDANLRLSLEQVVPWSREWVKGAHLELGVVNLKNTLPQGSNDGTLSGFDGTQGDLRGRFAYVQVGARW
jgi:iron complex outermembrane recepter protein